MNHQLLLLLVLLGHVFLSSFLQMQEPVKAKTENNLFVAFLFQEEQDTAQRNLRRTMNLKKTESES